jgi:hypothetical protein|tara:strand:- start:96 stop:278 length:183 start_codon:yes stop_codon:yes gene_type:complete
MSRSPYANHTAYKFKITSDMGKEQTLYSKKWRELGVNNRGAVQDCERLKQQSKEQFSKLS